MSLFAVLTLMIPVGSNGARSDEGYRTLKLDTTALAELDDRKVHAIDVLANGWLCAEFIVSGEGALPRDQVGNLPIMIGLPAHYPVCRDPSAALVVVTSDGTILQPSFVEGTGDEDVVTHLDPEPAGEETSLVISPALLERTDLFAELEVYAVTEAVSELCGVLGLTEDGARRDSHGDVSLRLDDKGVPPICSVDGTVLELRIPGSYPLHRRPVVAAGQRVMLTTLGPVAPHTSEERAQGSRTASGSSSQVVVLGIAAFVVVGGLAAMLRVRRTPV